MLFIVKNTTFPNLFDLLFPHSCMGCECLGSVLCECCKKNILQATKTKKELSSIYAVGERSGLLGELIHDYKYHSIRALAKPLAELIDAALPQKLPKNCAIVPLPTATHHVRARGLDHTYLIGKNLSKIRHMPLKRILIRNKNTVQVGSDRNTRLKQATSAYALNPKIKINKNTTYVLLDDVYTTGASIEAAKEILKAAGAQKIIAALLARSS